ncbi:5083_t:CDS:2 [Rhizophagus irregularis]|nr:5083_t:CDS:2 [Rhizophagus irregularis]
MDDITWTDTGSLMPRKLDAPGKEGKRAFSSYNIDRSGIDDASKKSKKPVNHPPTDVSRKQKKNKNLRKRRQLQVPRKFKLTTKRERSSTIVNRGIGGNFGEVETFSIVVDL